jgi:hypothetical protein
MILRGKKHVLDQEAFCFLQIIGDVFALAETVAFTFV